MVLYCFMENKKPMLPKWLQKTQHNSWEPEIFISGIVLFGLLQLPEYLNEFRLYFKREVFGLSNNVDNFVGMMITGIQWLSFGLILHLFFRGIWIGLVGLSYVFPSGIKNENLDYQGKFKNRINAIPDFTDQIIRLEKISSSIFSISYFLFMSILGAYSFVVISIIIPVYFFLYLGPYGIEDLANNPSLAHTGNSFTIGVLCLGLIYMFEFLSLGLLKKWRFAAKIYYPLYRVVSVLTFSHLYRNIYYILISNFKKWKVAAFILGFITITFFLVGFNANTSSSSRKLSQLEFYGGTEGTFHSSSAYENLDGGSSYQRASIQSDIVKEDVLRLFITHYSYYDDSVKVLCDYKEMLSSYSTDSLKLECLSQFYMVSVDDSTYSDIDWRFHLHQVNKHRGIIAYLDISQLERGNHIVEINHKNWPRKRYQQIPFYKE